MSIIPRASKNTGSTVITGAAGALGAGVAVEHILPGELFDAPHPEALPLGELLPRLGVRLFQAGEVAVGDGGEDVHVLAVGEIDDEGEEHEGMEPPAKQG